MMALQLLPILQIIIILCTPSTLSYPVYGTKSQTYPDDYYYPQESYPVYYPPARTSKYEVYQAVLPYYYQERPVNRPNYKYYSYNDPVVDLQEEMIQEAEREQREESQPIGHEMLYENDDSKTSDDSLDDVNAAFLQNLIMSQMYQDAVEGEKDYYDPYTYGDYGKWAGMADGDDGDDDDDNDDDETDTKTNRYQEDQDVKELKQLAKISQKQNTRTHNNPKVNHPDDIHWFQRSNFRNQNNQKSKYDNNDYKRSNSFLEKTNRNDVNRGIMVYTDRKPIVKPPSTTTAPATSSIEPKRDVRGQKEEVLMRPATPVRHPFSSPVLEMMTKNDIDKKRAPSVYDTIKHMLDMEKSLENKHAEDEIRPSMKKRIITTDENLIRQLTVLKKAQ